jgi:hypothetical protein
MRVVEKGAASMRVKDNTIYASNADGTEFPVLSSLSQSMYVDDTDGNNMFIGLKTLAEKSQHSIRLGQLSHSSGR